MQIAIDTPYVTIAEFVKRSGQSKSAVENEIRAGHYLTRPKEVGSKGAVLINMVHMTLEAAEQVLAAAYATQMFFPDWSNHDLDQLAAHVESRAVDRQQRCKSEDPTAAKFWQIYHYLNEDVVTTIDADGEREEVRETLNHSIDKELIAINIEHFQQRCRMAGQEVIPDVQLRRALYSSTTHKFIEIRKARSRIEKRSLNLWFFSKRGALQKSSLDTTWQRFITRAIKDGVLTDEQRFALHDLKRRGVTDTPGDRKQKQDASGHRDESMLDIYDFSMPLVSPSAE